MTEIVGVLNITPDSFSDGGNYAHPDKAVARIDQMFEEGADMIDIGAESTRPGATEMIVEQEWFRLEPVLRKLQQRYSPNRFSIDTRHGEVARRTVISWSPDLMINDVSGLADKRMVDVIASCGLRVVIGHLPLRAQGNVIQAHQKQKMTSQWEVRDQLVTTYLQAITQGIIAENIVLDPGIGFGKNSTLNKRLIGFAALLPGVPVMVGYSRKRFLGPRRKDPMINVEAGRHAVRTGAAYIRVHDVAAHYKMLQEEKQGAVRVAML